MSIYFTGPNDFYSPVSERGMYSDSTPMVKMPDWDKVVANATTMTVTGGSMAQFVTAMFLCDAVYDAGGFIKHLVIPYLPGARQDRSNPTGDVLFTAKSVVEMISLRAFDEVIILDPHSDAVVNLMYPEPIIYPLQEVIYQFDVGQYDGVIAPDKGAKSRAEKAAKVLNVPVFYGGKTRDVSTGKLTGFELEDLSLPEPHYTEDGHFLVVDDICDGGGTFIGLAEKIAEQGATADLYVSHGIFSKGTDELKKHYHTIYTTDSLAGSERSDLDVTVLAVVKKMENYNG